MPRVGSGNRSIRRSRGKRLRPQARTGESGSRGHAMKCAEAKQSFSPMLDSLLDGCGTRALDLHMAECESCAAEFAALRRTKWLMATMAPHAAPSDLALRLNVALSQHLAARRQNRRPAVLVRFLRWENALNAFMLPATGGLLSAVLIFGLLFGVLTPSHLPAAHDANDVPTNALHSARDDGCALRPRPGWHQCAMPSWSRP